MNRLIIAILEASVALLIFYSVYALWLKNDTFFSQNRFYLLFSSLLSILVPWISIPISQETNNGIVFSNILDTITVSTQEYEIAIIQKINTLQWISTIYLSGVLIMTAIFILNIYRVIKIVDSSFGSSEYPDYIRFVNIDIVPFSFINKIYINPQKYTAEQMSRIISHEKIHIREWHSLDCLFYEMLIIFFWFNPIVYKYRKSAKEIHEYLADLGAVNSGISIRDYQVLLFQHAAGLKSLSVPNYFNYSLIKKRLIMLTKIESSKRAKLKVFFVLPFAFVIVLAFACNRNDSNMLKNQQTGKIIDTDLSTDKIMETCDHMPVYKGGIDAIKEFIMHNITYPEEAKKDSIEGRVYVEFIVTKTGKVTNVTVAKGVNPLLDNEAVRVVEAMPDWEPGTNEGKPVNVSFTIPIKFAL